MGGGVLCWGMPYPVRVSVVEKDLSGEKAFGIAYSDLRLIELHDKQCESERMDTLIHELLHLMRPSWREKEVIRVANYLTRHLWAQGYRRKPPSGSSGSRGGFR